MMKPSIILSCVLGCVGSVALLADVKPLPEEIGALEAAMSEIELSEPKWGKKRVPLALSRENRIIEQTGPRSNIWSRMEVDAAGHIVGFANNSVPITDDDFAALAAALPKLNWIHMGHWGPYRQYRELYSNADFDGSGLRAFANTSVKRAFFGGTQFDNEGLKALLDVPNIDELYLNHSQIDDEGLRFFAAHPTLRVLEINASFSKKYTNETLQILSTFPHLERLSVGSTWLTYAGGLEHIAKMENLKWFELKWCIVSPEDLEQLKAARPDLEINVIDISKVPGSKFVYPRMSKWVPAAVLEAAGVRP